MSRGGSPPGVQGVGYSSLEYYFSAIMELISEQVAVPISRLSRVRKFQLFLWVAAFFVMMLMQQDLFILSEKLAEDRSIKAERNSTQFVLSPTTSKDTIPIRHDPSPTRKPTAGTSANQPTIPPNSLPVVTPTTLATLSTPTQHPSIPPTVPVTTKKNTSGGGTTIPLPLPSTISILNHTLHMAPDIYQGKSHEQLPKLAQDFLQTHCDMQNVKEWYPTTSGSATTVITPSWKQRAPYVILAGVWNGGIASLQQALQQHPQVGNVGLPDFFLPRNFYRYYPTSASGGAKVFAARERMYAQVYRRFSSSHGRATTTAASPGSTSTSIATLGGHVKEDGAPLMIAMDVSPGYLFHARHTSISIQCVSPWSKVVILLRDPVDRVYRQWVFSRENLGLRLSLEDWIAQELKAMQSAGLLSTVEDDNGNMDHSSRLHYRRRLMSKGEEKLAWKVYQSKRNPAGAIGRSMYVLQLEEWFETLRSIGKEPSKEVFLMRSEVWESQPQTKYQSLLKFLGLAPYAPSTFTPPPIPDPVRHEPMKAETKKLLEDFFEPYNHRLAIMLQQNGFNDDADWNEPLWS